MGSYKKESISKRIFFLLNLPKSLPLAWNLLKDGRLPLKNKVFFLGLSLLYLFFPFDLIFDIPLIGQLDDFTLFLFLFNWFLKQVPAEILEEYGWQNQ